MLRAPSYVTSANRLMVPSATMKRMADWREAATIGEMQKPAIWLLRAPALLRFGIPSEVFRWLLQSASPELAACLRRAAIPSLPGKLRERHQCPDRKSTRLNSS